MTDDLPHQTADAVAFLGRWFGLDAFICLTSIVPDGKTTTRTFKGSGDPALAPWIEERQGVEGIYWTVNELRGPMSSKPAKESMARMVALHLDLDPRVNEPVEEAKARILGMMAKAATPKASVIIDSGSGMQFFWRLASEDKLEIGGNVSRAQELEAYNIQLSRLHGGDNCHNIDRLMRLPGTINLPNLRKLKKGRIKCLATLVEFNDSVYPLAEFVPAVQVQPKNAGLTTGGQPKVKITGNVPVIGTEELQAWCDENGKKVNDHMLALIATGDDPINPGKYPSRSEAVFAVCCGLVRAGIPEEIIFAVLVGPNEIAASVKEKRNPSQYATRQIARAMEHAIDPALCELNERHAVIGNIGGRCRIISEEYDETMGRDKLSKSTFEDFRNRYSNKRVQIATDPKGNPVYKKLGHWWIDHEQRRQYDSIVFAPNREIENAYNLWQGYNCEAVPGDKHEALLHHVLHNVCSGNVEHYTYLIGWLARLVQDPGTPGQVAVVMRGKKGTGKSFLVKQVGALFGRHYLQVSNSKHLTGQFNAHLRDVVLLFGDEAFFAGDKSHEGVLKTLITEDSIVVEGKGVDAESAMNYVHLFLASNEQWVVPASLDERRFFVLEVGEDQRQNTGYFKSLQAQMDDGGLENFLHYLLSYDLSEYEVRNVPQTKALQNQKLLSMGVDLQWFYERLCDGHMLPMQHRWESGIVRDALYMEYVKASQLARRGMYNHTPTTFTKFIAACCPKGGLQSRQEMCDYPVVSDSGQHTTIRKRAQVYHFPSLDVLRAYWDKEMGGPYDWPKWEGSQEEIDADRVRAHREYTERSGSPF